MKINLRCSLPQSDMTTAGRWHGWRTALLRLSFLATLAALTQITTTGLCSPVQAQDLENLLDKSVAEVRVQIEGASGPATVGDELRSQIVVREGTLFSMVQVHASLVGLYASTRASNARVEATLNTERQVIVTFIITPQARIGVVEFAGVVGVNIEDLKARLSDLDRGSRYSEAAVRRGAELIYEGFRDRGFYEVSVEPKVTLDPTGGIANILYNVVTGAPAIIETLTIEGAPKIDVETLKTNLKSKPGSSYSRLQLTDDIRQIRDLHLAAGYLDARIGPPDTVYNDERNAISIRLPIVSGPVFTVRVDGLEIKEKKLREVLPLLREGGVDQTSLEEAARRLRSHLQEEGYFFAEVTAPPLPDPTAGSAEIVFKADPKQRYRITDIRIEGTSALSFEQISGDLRSKTESFFPIPIFSRYTRGITSEQSLRRDADLVVTRLRELGYRRARMASINRAVNPDNDRLVIIFSVEEGPRSYLSEITFTGNNLNTVDELRALISLKAGDPAALVEIKIEGGNILQNYFDRGYALATVSSRLTDLSGNRVRVSYEIREGPQVYINWVRVNETGSRQRTRSGRVETFLRFKAGELLQNDDLVRTEQDLYAIGAFRRVQVRSEPLGPEGETGTILRDVFVDLDEGSSRNLIYGGGYQSDEGIRGILEVSDPNIFGRLTTASLRMRASQRNLLGQLSYTDPRPFGLKTPVLAALFLQRERRPAFNSRRATALVQLERRISDQSVMLFRYSFEDVRVTNPEQVIDRRDRPVRLGRISASYAFDIRDNPFDATSGRYHSFDVSVALRALGGNEQFLRFFSENQLYHNVRGAGKTVLAGNLRVGMARSYTKLTTDANAGDVENSLLPITERFFTGGSTTLRGYDFEEAGPRDVNNRPRGGNALVIFNAELRQSVYRQLALVGFYDGGNVFLTASRINFGNLTHTAGLGLRIKTPLGPLRVDFGYLVSDPLTGSGLTSSSPIRLRRTQFHFSFGQAF
ncbi:MAG: POTRA domain-containing protein [Acidobacteriota bacterium]